MDGDEQLQVPAQGEFSLLASMCRPCYHSHFTAYKITLFFNRGLNSLTCQCWKNLNNLLVMKSETLITISSYKHQFCLGEVSGPLFLNLSRFQNYWRTTSHSLDSLFDFTLFLKVPLFVWSSIENSLKLMYFDPSHFKTSVFNWQLLASPTSVSNTFRKWCIVW